MNRQIERIRAESELRAVQANLVTSPPDSQAKLNNVNDYISRLTLEIGETSRLRRNIRVAPEPGARAKFLKLIE